jgi:tRNA G10  N-methylase Trm11
MVRLAGKPGEALLDPCCGSGTILAEPMQTGWQVHGIDIDLEAVQVARQNAKGATVRIGDARELPFEEGAVDACVSNLPFGQQYEVQDGMDEWLSIVLGEMYRVTRPGGGRIVLLAPRIPRAAFPSHLARAHRLPIRRLGTKTTIWAYDRR